MATMAANRYGSLGGFVKRMHSVMNMAALLRILHDIASGMHYLSKNKFIHRDLAARNVLVSSSFSCKVSDFGMSRDVGDDTYYCTRPAYLAPPRIPEAFPIPLPLSFPSVPSLRGYRAFRTPPLL